MGLQAGSGGRRAGMLGRDMVVYWLGNAAWLTFSQAAAATAPFATAVGGTTLFGIVQALGFSLGFFAAAGLDRARGPLGRWTLAGAAAGLCLAGLALALLSAAGAPWLLWLSAASLGAGRAAGFCQWIRILQLLGDDSAKRLLILGSASHIAMLFCLDSLLPVAWRPLVVFGLCAPAGYAALLWSTRSLGGGLGEGGAGGAAGRGRGAWPRELTLPLVCAVALTLITPIASSVFGDTGDRLFSGAVTPVSHGVCLLLLCALWFGRRADVTLPALYCVSLPLFASVILAASFAGDGLGWAVLFIGNGCYFLVSLLMVIACLGASARSGLGIVSLYGVFAGFMYLTDMAQLLVKYLTAAASLDLEPYVVALLLLYVVTIPVFFMLAPRARGVATAAARGGAGGQSGAEAHAAAARDGEAGAEGLPGGAAYPVGPVGPTDRACSVEEACRRIAARAGLTARQAEVLEALAGGRDVRHIAAAMSLSVNTVQSYRKSLYAALGVHGRQELLDLVDRERGLQGR